MIFIADSGSTKCNAVFLDKSGNIISKIETIGFNPLFHSSEWIKSKLVKVPEINSFGTKVTRVFFYGASCSSPARNSIVSSSLKYHFPNAEIEVNHDILASAYAVYQGEPVTSCILGTGSSSAFFDGKKLTIGTPSLSYILGDEGSASHIGKLVLASYFYGQMPAEAEQEFKNTYHLSLNDLLNKVYAPSGANVFIGGFAAFAGKHSQNSFFREMISSCFDQFLEIHVLNFSISREAPVGFTGSIAYYFRDILKNRLKKYHLREGVIIQKPLDNLISYHKEYRM